MSESFSVQLWEGIAAVVSLAGGDFSVRRRCARQLAATVCHDGTTVEIIELASCNPGTEDFEAVRQAVLSVDLVVLTSPYGATGSVVLENVFCGQKLCVSTVELGRHLAQEVQCNGIFPQPLVMQLVSWFMKTWEKTPLGACILVGGKSRRMGQAKHLIRTSLGVTWIEKTVQTLQARIPFVVVSGAGDLPVNIDHLPRVDDVAGVAGPIAGIFAVLQKYRCTSWVVTACDMPVMQPEALDWLISWRKPGVRGVLPDLSGAGRVEPLLAYYDFRVLDAVEKIISGGSWRVNKLKKARGVLTPQPPPELWRSWVNINTPEELENNP